ncbi:MAG TPA: TrpB-like pyridoxal phosphate-dependent enzyme [Armatimonadota bacterium]|nr:TrpB-like pyridoxal phosphate-dependent enzyme [Armatimonadota bacterium]
MQQRQFLLGQKDIPKQWYNIAADIPVPPPPPLNPVTKEPAGPQDLSAIFCNSIIEQEISNERWIDIPEPVLDALAMWRPSPLYRAIRLEEKLGTPAKIFYKYEGTSPVGSHKLNTALAQAYYNKQEGIKRLATETGAGQWGCALALSCSYFGMECTVYMVKVSYHQKPYRKSMIQSFGATIYPSPSPQTKFGRSIIEKDPDSPGSLGIAISEALEDTVSNKGVKYSLGSVSNHVLLHQTVIGQECKKQMEMAGVYPDVVIGCVGGGSNFAGIAFPFIADKIAGKEVRAVAVEPTACPTLTKGEYRYDFGDTAQMTPLFKMYTLGSDFMPPGIHSGGLRYHGMAPLVSLCYDQGLIEAVAYPQLDVFDAAVQFAKAEGIIPAPESSHAIKCAIDEAIKAKEEGKERVILFNVSGNGYLDLGAYDAYFAGQLTQT